MIFGVCIALKGPFLHPDSFAFLEMSINRSPLYVLFLKLFTTLFGDNYLWPLIGVQFLAIVFSTHFLLKTIKKQFDLHFIEKLVLQFILLSPSVYFNYTTGSVHSEAVSHPLVLLVFAFGFKAFASTSIRPLLKSIIPLYFLILTRGQFIVFYGLTKVFAVNHGLIPKGANYATLFKYFNLERGLIFGGVSTLFGSALLYFGFVSDLKIESTLMFIFPAIITIALGIQVILFSFFFSILGLVEKK